jgi:hypothetical protein
MLSCENASTDPYRIEKTARTMNSSCQYSAPSGITGRTIRRKPYTPTFESTPDSSASTGMEVAR